jgi:hypothetical protein
MLTDDTLPKGARLQMQHLQYFHSPRLLKLFLHETNGLNYPSTKAFEQTTSNIQIDSK